MRIGYGALGLVVSAAIVGSGCGATTTKAEATNAAATSAPPAASTPAPSAPKSEAPASAAATAAPSDPASVEAARKKNQIEWALKLDEIKNDPNGQWAAEAQASSSFNDAQGRAAYSANQASGPPNVEAYGSSIAAWTPKTADAGIEWLDLQFPKAVHATKIRIRESNGTGSVIKVEVFDEQDAAHTVWTGTDSTKGLEFLVVELARTTFKTRRVKLTLATNVVPGWNAIDAVQLVGTDR